MPLFRSPRVRSGLRHLRFVWRREKRETGVYSNRGIVSGAGEARIVSSSMVLLGSS